MSPALSSQSKGLSHESAVVDLGALSNAELIQAD